MKIKNLNILGICLLLFAACGIKAGGGGRISKYAQSYFKGEGKILYYVKPVGFTHNKENLDADFTFNKGDTSIKDVLINLSIYGNPPFTKADSVRIGFGNNSHTDATVKLIYNENMRRKKFSRQSIDLPAQYFESLLKAEPITITLFYGATEKQYISGKQWRKSHQMLYNMIFW